jgi:hypothetical protein
VEEVLDFCGIADLVHRWGYTRQGVHLLVRSNDFPAPAFVINNGRTKVWAVAEIAAYEATHPELTNEWAKRRKVLGFFKAVSKG